jgi:hypothetical protein
MAEFSWAYIDSAAIVSASGPTGSIQYRVADNGGNTAVSGTQNFVFHTASNLLAITGSVEISGTLTANQYNINVIDKTVTNLSASGDTIFGDTADDTHQFTGSVYVNGPLSASANISASAFYGDGSTLTGISPAGSNTEVQFNNAGAFGASPRATIVAGVSTAALVITGSVTVTGSALNTATTIDGTHVSSSLNISGSSIYAEDGFYGDINVPSRVTHDGDADTYLDFTDDKLEFTIGNRKFLTMTEAGNPDTFVINHLNETIETTINTANGDSLSVKGVGVIINDAGATGADFRVESNQKQNAIYLDADLQYVHLLADDATPAGGLGADMALFVSGTIGSKNGGVRGTAVFGGDMVVSGNLYGAYGNSAEIQFNNGGAFGASPSATVTTTPDGSSMLTLTGSLQVVSGSTKVLQVDSSDLGLGEVRGRMVQHIRTGFDLSDADDALAGRYVSIGGNAVAVSATPNQVNCMITPFSGRLVSIMYHMPSPASKQDPSRGQPQWQLRVGDVNALKGQTFANAFSTVGQITASSWPGSKVVGGVDIQTKIGSLHGNNITGSFSFGTGSVVALFFKSADTGLSANNFPGAASFTTVWEFDQLDPYNSGSGN